MAVENVPEWLTNDFLKSCLQSDGSSSQDITIVSHHIEPAVAPGNNYGSLLFRVKIEYKMGNICADSVSLIVKGPTTSGFMEELKDFQNDFYKREPNFYNTFINETYKICKHDIVPKHYRSPNPLCVVMEDLKTSGYVMVDRRKLLDFDHCQLYIKASSKLHALSMALHEKNPEMMESLVTYSPEAGGKLFSLMVKVLRTGLMCTAAYLGDKPKYERYLKVIKEGLQDNIIVKIYMEMESSKRRVRALQQGNPYCTNMMFRYDTSGHVDGVKLLDFQVLKFTTPVWDLVTFLWSSADLEVRETKIHDLYHLYCESLNSYLEEFGCTTRLSYEELKAEVYFLSPMILFCICSVVPSTVDDEPLDPQACMNDTHSIDNIKETAVYKLYKSTYFNKYYPRFIDHIAREGVFDDIEDKIRQARQN